MVKVIIGGMPSRERLKRLFSRRSLPAWLIFSWNVLGHLYDAYDTASFINYLFRMVAMSGISAFLSTWGWLIGIAWLTVLVLWPRRKDPPSQDLKETINRLERENVRLKASPNSDVAQLPPPPSESSLHPLAEYYESSQRQWTPEERVRGLTKELEALKESTGEKLKATQKRVKELEGKIVDGNVIVNTGSDYKGHDGRVFERGDVFWPESVIEEVTKSGHETMKPREIAKNLKNLRDQFFRARILWAGFEKQSANLAVVVQFMHTDDVPLARQIVAWFTDPLSDRSPWTVKEIESIQWFENPTGSRIVVFSNPPQLGRGIRDTFNDFGQIGERMAYHPFLPGPSPSPSSGSLSDIAPSVKIVIFARERQK